MVLLEVMSVRDVRGCISLSDSVIMLWTVKVVVHTKGIDTVARALRIIDGAYLFHLVLVIEDECRGVRWVAWWRNVRHLVNAKYTGISMSIGNVPE